MSLHGSLPRQMEGEGGFPDRGACGDDGEFSVLQSGCHVVQVCQAGRDAGDSVHAFGDTLFGFFHRVGHQCVHVAHVVVVSEFTFQAVEQVVCVYQCVGYVHCFVQRAGEEFVESQYHFSPQIFLVYDLHVIFDMRRGGYFAAQLRDAECSSGFFQLAPVGKFFFDGEDVDLHSCPVHGKQGGVDHLVARGVEHFRAQCVGCERHGFLFYQAGPQDGFFYLRGLWGNSVVSIHSERLYWINNCRHVG